MGNKLKPTYFAVTPISAVTSFLGEPGYQVWIPQGSGWQRIDAMPPTYAPVDGFAIVATTAKVMNVAGARKLGGPFASFGGDADPWGDPPPLTDGGETIESYADRATSAGIIRVAS